MITYSQSRAYAQYVQQVLELCGREERVRRTCPSFSLRYGRWCERKELFVFVSPMWAKPFGGAVHSHASGFILSYAGDGNHAINDDVALSTFNV